MSGILKQVKVHMRFVKTMGIVQVQSLEYFLGSYASNCSGIHVAFRPTKRLKIQRCAGLKQVAASVAAKSTQNFLLEEQTASGKPFPKYSSISTDTCFMPAHLCILSLLVGLKVAMI